MTEPLNLADLVDRLVYANTQMQQWKQEADGIKATLRSTLGNVEGARIGEHTLTIRPTMRFAPDLALTVLTPEELSAVSATVPDASRARLVLSPQRFAQCQRASGEMTVRVT